MQNRVSKLTLENYLDSTLETLFRPKEENGYWDDEEGTIIRALKYSEDGVGNFVWFPDTRKLWRYPPFALMGVMLWRTSTLGSNKFDEKIKRNLDCFHEAVMDDRKALTMPSYGIGPIIAAFNLAGSLRKWSDFRSAAQILSKKYAFTSTYDSNEDSLLLFGASSCKRKHCSESERTEIERILKQLLETQQKDGIFRFGSNHPEYYRHQNQMYTLWGLTSAMDLLKDYSGMDRVERTLSMTVETRMQEDGSILWFKYSDPVSKLRNKLYHMRKGLVEEQQMLFSCHQFFFIYAALRFASASGNEMFDDMVLKAFSWITGNNILKRNLFEMSGIGVPMRMMMTDGTYFVDGHKFIGAYEIGAAIMALTSMIEYFD